MAILNKPNSGAWTFSSDTFGANSCPAPDSLFMMEETSGQIINSGKDLGSFDSNSLSADFTGAAATGDSYLNFIEANIDTVEWDEVFGITAYPFTMAVVFRSSFDRSSTEGIMAIGDVSESNVQYALEITGTEQASIRAQNTAAINASTTGNMANGSWHLATVVFRNATDREVYYDGSSSTNEGNSVTFNSNIDIARMGARARGTPSNYLTGNIAALMVWKATGLSDAQVQTDLYNSGDPWGFLGASGENTSIIVPMGPIR